MRWKTARAKSKVKRKTRLAVLVLALILGLLLAGQIVRVGRGFLSPLSTAETKRTYRWDGTFNLNLVALTKPLSLISYNPLDHSIKILEIPDETYLEVPGGFGSWKAGAIFRLGEGESPPKGAVFLKSSMENFLSLPIDGFIQISQQSTVNSQQLVNLLRGNPWEVLIALPNTRTDLTPLELGHFYLAIKGVRFDKIHTFNLADLGLLTLSSLADGTPILVGDPAKIDALVTKNFTEGKIVGEAATIGVFNATKKPGLAGKSAQMITHLGGNVIIQTSDEFKESQTTVYGDKEHPYTTKRLRQIFASTCRDRCDILGSTASARSRAQVNLILGQ